MRDVLRGFLEDWILFFQSKISTFERESSRVVLSQHPHRERKKMKKIHRVGGEKMTSFSSSLLLPLLLLLSCCRANASEQQQQQKTVISQQKLENGVLFKVVVSASVPVDSSDVLFNRGVLATTKAQKIRVWCLDMQPRAGKKKNKKNEAEETEENKSMELSDVFLWHDETTDSQDWYEKKESIGNQLAKKNVRSVACDMPGYGRSEGEKKFAASSDLARSSFQEQLFEKLEMKRPVVFAPGVSMSYVVDGVQGDDGGVATCDWWGVGGGESGEEKEYGTGVEIFEDDVGEVAGESE